MKKINKIDEEEKKFIPDINEQPNPIIEENPENPVP